MAYTFKSRSAASVTLLRASGDDLLRLVGKSPSARGVLSLDELPRAIAAIEAAIAPPGPAAGASAAPSPAAVSSGQADDDEPEGVTLRQRALPFLQLLRAAQAAGDPVTWGVV